MYLISKLFTAITQPMFWLALWWGCALLMLTRRRRTALVMLWSGLAMLGLLGFQAIQVAALLGERCQEAWLLVTSAWHMPRAMTEFEALGCRVTAYPVDFRTGARTPWSEYSLASSLVRWQVALHEWLGLIVYQLTADPRRVDRHG